MDSITDKLNMAIKSKKTTTITTKEQGKIEVLPHSIQGGDLLCDVTHVSKLGQGAQTNVRIKIDDIQSL